MLKIIASSLVFLSSSCLAASPAPIVSNEQMVVSAQHYATVVGKQILEEGGNAVDAAVAIGYALAVVHPCCGNLGGGGFMLIRFPNGASTFLNFREKAPGKARPELYLDKQGRVLNEQLSTGHLTGDLKTPYLAVGVPGTVMGLNTALTKYGTMTRSQVINPAIKLAQKGFILLPADASIFKIGESSFKRQPNVAAIYLKNGYTYTAGQNLIQNQLANTLKIIANEGTPAFYRGKIANEIVAASVKNGGLITKLDLANYQVEELRPLECTYKNYHILTTPPPGSGVTVCEALKILESYPLERFGFHSALGSHYVLEALRFSYADRNLFLGDPDFVQNPLEKLLSATHIQAIRQAIKPERANSSTKLPALAYPRIKQEEIFSFNVVEGSNTTSYAVVDRKGMAVSVTYTLNDYFGAKVIPGNTGFFLNNELADFTIRPGIANNYGLYQGRPNLMAPNKRPLSSMAPTIITQNGQLFMVIGTPGGSTIPSTLVNVILNVITYGMNIQEAEDMPRFHMQWLPDMVYMEKFSFSKDTQTILAKMGYRFQLGSPYDSPYWGAVSGIVFNPATHTLFGAMDSRRSNGAAAGQ